MFRMIFLFAFAFCVSGTLYGGRNRIAGGVPTTIEDHPYQVSMNFDWYLPCGGSLIARNWVLTSWYCISMGGPDLVSIGSTFLHGGSIHFVKNRYPHPKGGDVDEYDIALLELERPVELTNKVQLIELADEKDELRPGNMLNVTGWGLDEEGKIPETLQQITVPYVSYEVCSGTNNNGREFIPTENMICTDKIINDVASGDGGGALVRNKKQYGVVAFTLDSGFSVYTKVGFHRKWIREISGV